MFLQVHALTSYHATLLNRDDAGLAKRIPFGDAERIRISSQCQKRHWREALAGIITTPGAFRSRHFFDREMVDRLVKAGIGKEAANERAMALKKALVTAKDKKSKGDTDENDETESDDSGLEMGQAGLFGKPEADYFEKKLLDDSFVKELLAAYRIKEDKKRKKALTKLMLDGKENYLAMRRAAGCFEPFVGFDGAMFGRFVTSDVLARTDAAVHVAHAFTVHGASQEIDFFTVVDDLNRDEETGSAGAFDMDLGAGLFYVYVAVDIPLLVQNFTGCEERKEWKKQDTDATRKAMEALITAIATVSPGAKKGSTAPYSYADLMLLETGTAQPRSLANAYLKAIKPKGDMRDESIKSLADQMAALDKMYGASGKRFASSTRTLSALGGATTGSLDEIIKKALDDIFGE